MSTIFCVNKIQGDAVRIALAFAGSDAKVEDVKTVHDKTPSRVGPVFQSAQGSIFGLPAVLKAIARAAPATGLNGSSFAEESQVDQWLSYASTVLKTNRDNWITPIEKKKATDPAVIRSAKSGVINALKVLNGNLATRTFMVGHQVTIADIYIFAILVQPFTLVLSKPACRPLANLKRWMETLEHDATFNAVVGEITYCVKEQFAPKPAVKKQQAKKQEKKAAKPKPKNPLDLLPPSRMNMDATKKLYFNQQPYNPTFFDTFWPDVWDPAGYCMYEADYKYNDENKQFWLTSNLIGGYMQRMDNKGCKAYGFGFCTISGANEEDNTPWKVKSVFIFRGDKVPFEFLDVPGADNYNWTKLNDDAAGRARFQELARGETIDGEPVLLRRSHK